MSTTTTRCPYCGEEIIAGARKCRHCGEWLDQDLPKINSGVGHAAMHAYQTQNPQQQQPVIIQNTTIEKGGSNSAGTAGFIFALLTILFSWAPIVKWVLWFLGFLLSFIGLFKRPRGLAVTGFLLSIIGIVIIIALVGVLASIVGSLANSFN